MAHSFQLLVGTMTGNAQLVAEEIQYALKAAGHGAEVVPMDHLSPGVFTDTGHFIVCTSTYGSGDVPDNARALFEALKMERPDLSRVRYALFGLGDSTYQDTYNFGGKKFEALLSELGATQFFESHFHNASGGTLPEDECADWTERLMGSLDTLVATS